MAFYDVSAPDQPVLRSSGSGYSVDNLAPAVPQGLVYLEPGALEWDPSPEHDFRYFAVYGSSSPEFREDAVVLGQTVAPGWTLAGDPCPYYHVTAWDFAANESGAAGVGTGSSSGPEPPSGGHGFALREPAPNPAHAKSRLRFSLPGPAPVRLAIFDASGRRVRMLVDDRRVGGEHAVIWDGRDDAGRRVWPGVFFARIDADGRQATRRVVVVR